jgi:hypothetical protein
MPSYHWGEGWTNQWHIRSSPWCLVWCWEWVCKPNSDHSFLELESPPSRKANKITRSRGPNPTPLWLVKSSDKQNNVTESSLFVQWSRGILVINLTSTLPKDQMRVTKSTDADQAWCIRHSLVRASMTLAGYSYTGHVSIFYRAPNLE